jgi:hypothetical protein
MKSKIFIALILVFSSCATVHKNSSSSTNEQQHIDTSSQEHQYQTETVTEEKATVPVVINADSVQTSGTMSEEDTTTYQQTVETDDMSLTTTVKPKRDSKGNKTGYDVSSKAVAKPKTIDIPIDRKITAKTSSSDKQQAGITETKKETVITSSKQAFRFNMAGACAIVGGIIAILLFLYFGGTFKKKNDAK